MNSLYERMGEFEGILAFLKPFYADVRQHAELGPVFNKTIQNWPEHMDRIAAFWSRLTGGPSNYDGGFAGAHLRLGIPPELALLNVRETLRCQSAYLHI
jgi:hemoglobin